MMVSGERFALIPSLIIVRNKYIFSWYKLLKNVVLFYTGRKKEQK